ncbi:MAG: hypothetical protein ABIP93_13595 [Gemmatimonadaceae bacterium]
MGLVDGFFLLGLFLFGLPLAALVGTLLGKLLNMPRLGGCLPGLVLLVIIFGVPVALRVSGVPGAAHIVEKRESVSVLPYTGTWYNRYDLVLHAKPPGASRADPSSRSWTDSITMSLRASREIFDRARVGQTIGITYLPFRPSIGKLTERSLLDLIREVLAVRDIVVGIVLVLSLLMAITVSRRSPTNPVMRAAKFVVLSACLVAVIGSMWVGYQNPAPISEYAVNAAAIGRVVQARRIDRTLFDFSNSDHSSAPLEQPFDVVEVEFTPPLLAQVVHAADAVDSGTVRGLEPGTPVRIRYDVSTPRTIRIDGATRTYRATNARMMTQDAAIMLAVVLGFLGLSTLLARRKHSSPRNGGSSGGHRGQTR